MAPNARSLIVDLLCAAAGLAVPVKDLVRACAVFDIRETSVRVAIVRLSAAGTLESEGRGIYRLGEKAQTLAREVGAWSTVEKRVRPWDGGYLATHLEPPRRDTAKSRARALRLVGLRELTPGFALRPDNLLDARERIEALGFTAPVFLATDFDPRTEAALRKLWDTRALIAGYRKSRARLERWLEKSDQLEPEVAARESFLLGGEAIRQIVYDPLLPAPFVDPAERRAFVDTMRTFDRVGRGFWLRLFGVELSASMGPEAEHRVG